MHRILTTCFLAALGTQYDGLVKIIHKRIKRRRKGKKLKINVKKVMSKKKIFILPRGIVVVCG